MLLIDLLLVALATVGAALLRDNIEVWPNRLRDLVPYLLASLTFYALISQALGLDRVIWRLSSSADYWRVLAGIALTVLASVWTSFLFNRLEGVSRGLPAIQAMVMVMSLVGVRLFVRERHQRRARLAADQKPVSLAPATHRETVLVVGLNRIAELYLQSVVEFSGGRIAIAGLLGRSTRHTGRLVQSHAILGRPEDVENVLRDLEVRGIMVDRIVVASAFDELSLDARNALLRVETTSSIRLELIAEWISGAGRRQPVVLGESEGESSGGSTFLITPAELQAIAARPYWRFKRAIDLIVVSAVVVILAPLQLLIALVVAIDIGVPVLFWQQRPGRGGRPFRLRKFRTMGESHGADGLRLADSARISTTGRFLRRTRLDELPQLYNILAGDMSFVGPRPLLPVDQPGACKARLIVRPGLTGWAQVMGGRDIGPADKAALDVWYVRNASFALDFKIVCLTIPMLIRGERIDSASISVAWDELERSGICARSDAIRRVHKMRVV